MTVLGAIGVYVALAVGVAILRRLQRNNVTVDYIPVAEPCDRCDGVAYRCGLCELCYFRAIDRSVRRRGCVNHG